MLGSLKIDRRFGCLLPGLALLGRQEWSLREQGANPVAADLARRMQPAEEPHPTKPSGQDMLKESANEFGRL